MMNLLAELSPTRTATLGEATLYAVLGYLIVFLGITFLIFVVWGVGKIMASKGAGEGKPKVVEQKPSVAPPVEESDEVTDEVIAVITAAIAAYYQKENKKCEFTVKRIKRL